MAFIYLRISGLTSELEERNLERAILQLDRIAEARADRIKGEVWVDTINGPPETEAIQHIVDLLMND